MRISSIIDIVDGELLNSPSISFIYSIKLNPFKVKQGDLFVAKNHSDIDIAIKNGAFAILLEKNHPIIDDEIAWIKVKDCEDALIKIARFHLSNTNINVFYCDEISYEILKLYKKEEVKLISNIYDMIKNLEYINEKDCLISYDKNLCEKIYPNNTSFENKKYSVNNLTQHSIFEISFSYENIFFSRLRLSSIYLENFLRIFEFFDKNMDTTKLKNIKYLNPIFLNKSYEIVDFGKSQRFVLVQDKKKLAKKEIDFIKQNLNYAKVKIITKTFISDFGKNQIIMTDIQNLKEKLKTIDFNSIYIYGYSYDEVYNSLDKKEKLKGLF